MKTSFYFILWIIIYPLLGLVHSQIVYNNMFFIALLVIWGISWILNRLMPETLRYESAVYRHTIFKEVNSPDVTAFRKRITRDAFIETLTAIYFCITLIVIIFALVRNGRSDWFSMAVFGFFTIFAVSRSFTLISAKSKLEQNPTRDESILLAKSVYRVDYMAYFRYFGQDPSLSPLPPMPKHYKAFQVFTIITAIIAALFGIVFLVLGVIVLFSGKGMENTAMAGMYFLYGSLACYFGVKDAAATVQSIRRIAADNARSKNSP